MEQMLGRCAAMTSTQHRFPTFGSQDGCRLSRAVAHEFAAAAIRASSLGDIGPRGPCQFDRNPSNSTRNGGRLESAGAICVRRSFVQNFRSDIALVVFYFAHHLFRSFFQHHELFRRAGKSSNQFVELALSRVLLAGLGVLDRKDHDQRQTGHADVETRDPPRRKSEPGANRHRAENQDRRRYGNAWQRGEVVDPVEKTTRGRQVRGAMSDVSS